MPTTLVSKLLCFYTLCNFTKAFYGNGKFDKNRDKNEKLHDVENKQLTDKSITFSDLLGVDSVVWLNLLSNDFWREVKLHFLVTFACIIF